MKQLSKKRQRIERSLQKVREAKVRDLGGCCEGCFTNQGPIENSHHIPKRRRSDLIDDPDNSAYLCRKCHLLVESGGWSNLNNEELANHIDEYVKGNESDYYYLMKDKYLVNTIFDGRLSRTKENLEQTIKKKGIEETIESLIEKGLITRIAEKAASVHYQKLL